MPDAFLAAHEIAPLCFDISGRFLPASIRDQMLRSFFLIEKLFAAGLLKEGSRILIVGAGVAGVAAGIRAAHRGVAVVIAEKSARPFVLQRAAEYRWLDPTQYDWPLQHWREEWFPRRPGHEMPLFWTRGAASKIAEMWDYQLAAAREKYVDRLELRCSTTFARLEGIEKAAETGSIRAVLQDGRESKSEAFHAVVFCHGFGEEITAIAEFAGIPSWSKSEKSALREGWTSGATLIIGGGDGAMQDFLLQTTGVALAREIFDILFPDRSEPEMERDIHCAEDQAQRAWAGSAADDHSLFVFLDEVAGKLAAQALEKPAVWSTLNDLIGPDLPAVTIAHSCTHFSRGYALNRFLTLLIIQFLTSRGAEPRKTGVRVREVRSADPNYACDRRDPDACFGLTHEVAFQPRGCEHNQGSESPSETYRRVIVRAGVNPPPLIEMALESGEIRAIRHPPQRQSLPYYPL